MRKRLRGACLVFAALSIAACAGTARREHPIYSSTHRVSCEPATVIFTDPQTMDEGKAKARLQNQAHSVLR
jgi:hypothetical protein